MSRLLSACLSSILSLKHYSRFDLHLTNLANVLSTQVKADMGEFTSSTINTDSNNRISSDSHSIPALGMAWRYCVNTKMSLHRHSAAVRVVHGDVDERGSDEVGEGGEGSGDEGAGGGMCSSSGYGGSGSVLGSKRTVHDSARTTLTHTQYGMGKHPLFSYDTANDTAPAFHTIHSVKDENTKPNITHNAYTAHDILPKLHGYITYYPIPPTTASTDTTKSTRYIRMDSSVHKGGGSCMYEISQLGVYGVK